MRAIMSHSRSLARHGSPTSSGPRWSLISDAAAAAYAVKEAVLCIDMFSVGS